MSHDRREEERAHEAQPPVSPLDGMSCLKRTPAPTETASELRTVVTSGYRL